MHNVDRSTGWLVTASLLLAAGHAGADPLPGPPCPGAGCCFELHANPGCDDFDCCTFVCDNIDPFCCDTTWDQTCVNGAVANCSTTPPCNNTCATATALILPAVDLNYNTANASTDGPAVDPGCLVDGAAIGADIWFSLTVPEDGSLFINNCLTAGFDTILVAYTGGCGGLTAIACSEDGVGCAGTGSTIQVDVTAGTEVLVRLGGVDGATGSGTLDVQIASDLCPGGGGDCCISNGTPGCDDLSCCSLVCGIDPFCCQVNWDGICADEAGVECPKLCIPPICGQEDAGSCCAANGTESCNDLDCCNTVCATTPACCDTEWDQACADAAVAACPGICDCTVSSVAPPEMEPCGSDTNGGCNSTPQVYTSIGCNTSIAGIAWADGGTRDTDWYQLIVAATSQVTVEVESELPTSTFILDGIATCDTVTVGTAGGGDGCVSVVPAVATLEPGTYAIFVGAGDPITGAGYFDGFPCGSGNDYEVTVTCAPPPSCTGDTNNDGAVDVQDLVNVILDWGTNGAANGGDVNGSGIVDVTDLTTVILNWGDC